MISNTLFLLDLIENNTGQKLLYLTINAFTVQVLTILQYLHHMKGNNKLNNSYVSHSTAQLVSPTLLRSSSAVPTSTQSPSCSSGSATTVNTSLWEGGGEGREFNKTISTLL